MQWHLNLKTFKNCFRALLLQGDFRFPEFMPGTALEDELAPD